MLTVKQGEVKEFTFTIGGGLTVSQLGTPTVVISQDKRTFALEIVSSSGSTVVAKVSKALSVLLTNDLLTYIQLSFNDGSGGILVFPPESVMVEQQYNEIVVDTSIVISEGEDILDVEIPESDFDESGEEISEYYEYVEPESEDEEEAYADDEDYEELPSYEDVIEIDANGDIVEDGFDVEPDEV